MKYAVVLSGGIIDNEVINVIKWDGISAYTPAQNTQLIDVTNIGQIDLGYTYNGSTFEAHRYFASNNDNVWINASNWYVDSRCTYLAASIPNSGHNANILGSVAPVIDLDAPFWVQPLAIYTGVGLTVTSLNSGVMTCGVSGDVLFTGSAVYGNLTCSAFGSIYFYTSGNNDWGSVSNWYLDPTHIIHAGHIPGTGSTVYILGTIPASANIDESYWVQPATIDTLSSSVIFYSENYGNISISISGTAVFNGNATYNM